MARTTTYDRAQPAPGPGRVIDRERARATGELTEALEVFRANPTATALSQLSIATDRLETVDGLAGRLQRVAVGAAPLDQTAAMMRAAVSEVTTSVLPLAATPTMPAPPLVLEAAPVLAGLGIEVGADPELGADAVRAGGEMGELEHLPTLVATLDPPEKQPAPPGTNSVPAPAVEWHLGYWWADFSMQLWTRSSVRYREELSQRAAAAVWQVLEEGVLADVIAAGTSGGATLPATGSPLDSLADELDAVGEAGWSGTYVIASPGLALRAASAVGASTVNVTVIGTAGVPAGTAIIAGAGALAFYRTRLGRLERDNAELVGHDVGLLAHASAVVRDPAGVRILTAA